MGPLPQDVNEGPHVRSDMRTGIFYRPPRKRLPYLLQADPHLDPPEVATGQSMFLRTSSFVDFVCFLNYVEAYMEMIVYWCIKTIQNQPKAVKNHGGWHPCLPCSQG